MLNKDDIARNIKTTGRKMEAFVPFMEKTITQKNAFKRTG